MLKYVYEIMCNKKIPCATKGPTLFKNSNAFDGVFTTLKQPGSQVSRRAVKGNMGSFFVDHNFENDRIFIYSFICILKINKSSFNNLVDKVFMS